MDGGAALMVSVSAWYLLKKRHLELAMAEHEGRPARHSSSSSCANFFVFGPQQAIEVTNNQPLKLASMEGLWQSTSCAPLYLAGWVDTATQTTTGISIPCLLSVLAYLNPQAVVAGHRLVRAGPTPPINLLFQVYHLMFAIGAMFVPIALLAGLLYIWGRRLYTARWMLWLLVITVFFGESAIIAGWWTAEIGRQPWVVYNVLATADGVSPISSAGEVVFSLAMFVALYAILLALFLYLLNRQDPGRAGAPGRGRDRRRRDVAGHVPRGLPTARPGRTERGGVMLAEIWFVLFVAIVAGYLILDGFDMGVGTLLVPLARTDTERRTFLNSIGPIWDGNEVWLVIAGGVLFAVFPLVYASLFSGSIWRSCSCSS